MSEKNQKIDDKVSQTAIDDLNCNSYMFEYRQCIDKNMAKRNFKECVHLMNDFRYCLLYLEQNKKKN